MKIKILKFISILSVSFLLFSCATASHKEAVSTIKNDKIKNKIPENFASNKKLDFDNIPVDDGWLKSFKDATLEKLVQEAMKKNPGLKLAEAQVDKARALAGLAESNLKPSLGLGGSYNTGKLYEGTQDYALDKGYAGAVISWELDVWGKVRNAVKAGEEALQAAYADFQFAKQSLAASVAVAWFMATESKLQHKFAMDVVKIKEETLKIIEARYKIGQGNERDVHLAKATLAAAKKAELSTKDAYKRAQRSLEILLGRYPSADIEAANKIVAIPPKIPVGIPSSILERRPDLIAAEKKVATAFYKKEEAKLLRLPSFTINAGIGTNNIVDAISGLSAGIFAPLYTGGAIEAEIARANAKQKAAIANYAKVALRAFKEVENTLSAENNLKAQEENIKIQTKEYKKAYEQTKKQYELGQITYLNVLNIQNKWINSKKIEIDIATKRLTNRVNLHLALGGSFEEKPKK